MTVEFINPQGQTSEYKVDNQGFIIGRAGGDATLQLAGDPLISRRHARIWLESGRIWYEDSGSANGSWTNGQRIVDKVPVETGSEIRLGQTTLLLKDAQRAAPVAEREPDSTMRISMAGKADESSLAAFSQEATKVELLGLAEFVHTLLGGSEKVPLEATLQRLVQSIPGVWRVSLVGWPLDEQGNFKFLVEPAKLERAGVAAGPISKSLALRAVERQEALLFSEDFKLDAQAAESCIMRGIRSAVYVPLLTPEGKVLGILCVDSPVPSLPLDSSSFHFLRAVGSLLGTALATEEMREEARLRELETRKLDARRESLANFLNIASHDLRNPLTVMRGCARIIENLDNLEKIHGLSKKIVSASTRAEELINTYLDVSEISSGQQIQLDRAEIELAPFVEEELEFIGQALANKNPRMVNDVPPGLTVWADPKKLRQIVCNLISNGIKYSPKEPVVRVGAEQRGDEMVVWVADNGVGISQEDQDRLFQKFLRVGDRTMVPGTGLGLWLAAALAETHGGKIWVESEVGHGSTFLFSLAMARQPA